MTDPESSFDWDDLLDCIEEKSVIPIIGQDLLTVAIDGKQQTLQQWLAFRLAEELQVSLDPESCQNLQSPSLNEVSLAFLDKAGDRQRRKIYARSKSLLEESQLPIPKSLEQLATISDFKLFVNLGFDNLLEQALDQVNGNSSQSLAYATNTRIIDLPCGLEELSSAHVFHLFGLAGTTTEFAVTEEDQLELVYSLQDETRRPELLFDELSANNLLFLGCGLQDWLQRFLIRVLTNDRLRDTRNTAEFIADNQLRHNPTLALFLQRYGTYNFLSGDPSEFVAELQRRWLERNPNENQGDTKTVTLPKMESGAVFLSFSSVDRDIVRNIKESLDQAGLDVWFDEQDLDYGISWDTEIQRNINKCSIFLPCISQKAAQVDNGVFRSEWKLAIKADQKMADSRRFIQPIILDDCPEHIDDIPAEFWDKQYTRLQEGKLSEDFVSQLVTLMRQLQLKRAG